MSDETATLDAFALPPISEDSPCGPDLDLDGDMDFLNYVAAREGEIPEDYYKFKRENVDLAQVFDAGEKLLARTLDIRLLVLLAKFSLLNKDLTGFARRVGSIAWLLKNHWADAHPRAEGGDYIARISQLATLDDPPLVIRGVKYATLIESSRDGVLSYRAQLVASGKETPRVERRMNERGQMETGAEENFIPAKSIERLLRDTDIEKLVAALATLNGLILSAETIKAATIENAGFEQAVQLPKLIELVTEMAAFLRETVIRRDPSFAPAAAAGPEEEPGDDADSAPAGSTPTGFASIADVDAALGAALGYFAASEPSSPAVLLIRQARETLGKNLYEVLKLLTPTQADAARVFVGPDSAFTVPVKNLSSATSREIARVEAPPAANRASALAIIDAVATHLQRAEPSSPAPYLLERARNLASRDFLSLLHDVLGEDAIAAMKKGK